MLKFVATSVLGCSALVCCAGDALACGCGSQAASCYMMNMDMSAPMPAMQDMPGMPGMPATPPAPQARVGTQYRSYSYQPAPTYYRPYSRSQAGGFQDAGFKARGGR